MIPVFEITADDNRITDEIRKRFKSLNITDAAGYESDQLTLVLEDTPDPITGQRIELPKKGVILQVALGYRVAEKTTVLPAGRWVVDEAEPSGGVGGDIITITANGTDFTGALKEKKTRAWQDIDLPGILETIGSEHKLTVKVPEQFKKVLFDQLDQTGESDINFITRLAKDHDALGKIVGNVLVFNPRNSGKNTDGKKIATVYLGYPGNVSTWRMNQPTRTKYGSVAAKWYDVTTSKYFTETVGDGEPVLNIEKMHANQAQAKDAALSKLKSSKRSDATLSLTGPVPFGTLMLTETNLEVSGMRKEVNGQWRVDRAQLSMTTGGFNYSLEAVKPGD
ncbi:contractile injection system protein, VgrG/Pvc8 family [Endozoicomonas ascidiicola]|uniref:contractile injection system protein, VgrG/Pvc8 family n=1 Tax=Endozoicomonas ascidiicola TaxID=1698521 RepID=UPI00082E5522|nr:contractile injection system protein, VgrG/Pvc8 family [Endozoicomonas ascidiicola]